MRYSAPRAPARTRRARTRRSARRRRQSRSPAGTRDGLVAWSWCFSWLRPPSAVGREVNGFLDAHVRPATADVAVHRGIDLRVGRLTDAHEQRRGRHELACLTVAALRHVEL